MFLSFPGIIIFIIFLTFPGKYIIFIILLSFFHHFVYRFLENYPFLSFYYHVFIVSWKIIIFYYFIIIFHQCFIVSWKIVIFFILSSLFDNFPKNDNQNDK